MKLYDVYKAVSQLGFEDSLGDDGTTGFMYAVNRALIEINSLRPRRRCVTISHRVPTNLLFAYPEEIEKTDTLTFTAKNAKSFYFEVCGKGSYAISFLGTDEGKSTTVKSGDFDHKNFTAIKGIITDKNGAFVNTANNPNMEYSGEVELKFYGDYDYGVRNIALYDRVYSDSAEDVVPFTKRIPYNMNAIVDDFERFDASPLQSITDKFLGEYAIENKDTILLPREYPGAYQITYIHKVTPIQMSANINDSDSSPEIDLDDDLAALMPILVASYVWLEDEADKAQYYYNLYTQRALQIQAHEKDITPVLFQSTNDW